MNRQMNEALSWLIAGCDRNLWLCRWKRSPPATLVGTTILSFTASGGRRLISSLITRSLSLAMLASDILMDLVEYVTDFLGGLPAGLEVLDDIIAGIAGILDRFPGFSVGAGGSEVVRVDAIVVEVSELGEDSGAPGYQVEDAVDGLRDEVAYQAVVEAAVGGKSGLAVSSPFQEKPLFTNLIG